MPGNQQRVSEDRESILENAKKRVDDQILVVAELKADGLSTASAERLLDTYRDVLEALLD